MTRLPDAACLRRAARFAAISSGLEAAALTPSWLRPRSAAGRGLIFTLHHVRPAELHPFRPNALLSVTPQFLDAAIAVTLACGLRPVRLEDLPERLADPDDKNSYVAFTLDDGYRDNAEHAAPIFRKHKAPYTIFLTSGFVERRHAPWWETAERLIREHDRFSFDFGDGPVQVEAETVWQKMSLFDRFADFVGTADEDIAVGRINAAAGRHGIDVLDLVDSLVISEAEIKALAATDELVSFGAHTVSHPNLKRVDDGRLGDEIGRSVEAVTRYIGRAPKAFAYPYGWVRAVGEREMRAVASAGFSIGVTTQPGMLHPAMPVHAMKRVSLNGCYQKERYVRALVSGIPFRFLGS